MSGRAAPVRAAAPRVAGRPLRGHGLALLRRRAAPGIVMTMPEQHVMNYIETDARADVTLIEWRNSHVAATPRRRRLRVPVPRLRPAFAF